MVRHPRRSRPGPLFLAALLAAAACRPGGDAPADAADAPGPEGPDGRPAVAVSVLPLAGLVDRLVPEGAAEVVVLVPPGSSPHAFEPGVEQLRDLARVRLVVLIGHPAFAWERTWLSDALGPDADRAVSLAESCAAIPDDPHVWLDPECLEIMARGAADALADALPEHAREIGDGLERFVADADSARLEAGRILEAGNGGRGRTFLVLHPAWGYFARGFGLEQLAILSHGSGDSGAARLAAVIDRARREGIRTVVVQPQYSADAARVVAEEIGGEVISLDPLERDPVSLLVSTARGLAGAVAP